MDTAVTWYQKIKKLSLASLISLSVMSCGSESVDTAGISGTGIVSGTITGFGSIFVNGVEYDIDNASFDVDGNTDATQDALGLGMVVKLIATDNNDGTGVATSVVYDDLVDGPIADDPFNPNGDTNLKQFIVMGQTVIISTSSTTFKRVTFANIASDDVIEVSGFIDQDRNIIATRIEKRGELEIGITEVEIHGMIEDLNSSISFKINGITIDISNIMQDDLKDLENGLENGLFVEVKGFFQSATTVFAKEIEGEDDDRDEISNSTGKISLQGIITGYISNSNFLVNGVSVDASSFSSVSLADGLEVEVEGNIISGVLLANELEIRSAEAKFKAVINSTDSITGSINISFPNVSGVVTLILDSQSKLENQFGPISPQDLWSIPDGSNTPVQVEAKINGPDLVVSALKIEPLSESEIEGVVTAKLANNILTMFGLDLVMDGGASYEISNVSKDASTFFSNIIEGITRVEVTDEDQDGLFDKAEID